MTRVITNLLIAVCFSTTGFSQVNSESSLLWEISGNQLTQPSYLFGTVHVICKENFFFPEIVKEKFLAATSVYLEAELDDPSFDSKWMSAMQLDSGKTIQQLLGDNAFNKFDSCFTRITGESAIQYNNYKPLMLIGQLSNQTMLCQETESYEQWFINLATLHRIEIKGLETNEEVVAVFDAIPDDVFAEVLLEFALNFQQQLKISQRLESTYKTQDIDLIFNDAVQAIGVFGKEFLEVHKRRNANWIPIMQKSMLQSSSFFAVGAGHLGGDIGVVALLRKLGYTVKPVKL